jgi:hypothetical protein
MNQLTFGMNCSKQIQNFVEDSNTPPSCGALCLEHSDVPLLQNIRTGLIDPDTPDSAKTIKSANGKDWELVVSSQSMSFVMGSNLYVIVLR